MRKRKIVMSMLAVLVALALVSCGATRAAGNHGQQANEQKVPEPLVIDTNTPKVEKGTVTIYQDDIVIYQYKGPFQVTRNGRMYDVEIETQSCPCVQESVEETEVDENE